MDRKDKTIKFDIGNVNVEDNEDSDFMILDIDIASTVPNSHHLVFSKDCLERCGKTFFLKPIIGEYSPFRRDTRGHEVHEDTYGGFFDKDSIRVVDVGEDAHLMAKGFVWKNYCEDIYELFKRRKDVSVSMEVELTNYDENTGVVDSFVGRGCTLLGADIRPSIPTSHASVVSFSEMQNKFNEEYGSLEKLRKMSEGKSYMADEKKETYVSHSIDATKEAVDDGDWDGNKAKQDLVKEKNYESLAPKVCLRLEDGWKDRQVTKLGYPVMNLKDGKWVYNRKGLASALGYAQKEGDKEVVSKVEAIYKKLGLDKEEMAKMAEIEGRKAWGEVIDAVQKHEGKGVYVDSVEDDHIIFTKDKVRYVVKADVKVGEDDKKVHATIHWDTVKKDEDQKMSEEEVERKEEDDKKDAEVKKDENPEDDKKDFSSNANADPAAMAEFLKREAEYNAIMAKEFTIGDDYSKMADEDCDKKMQECMEDMNCLVKACGDYKFMDEAKFEAIAKRMADMAKEMKDAGAVVMANKKALAEYKASEECKENMAHFEKIIEEAGCFDDGEKAKYLEAAKAVKKEDMAALENEIKARAFEKTTAHGDMKGDAQFAASRPTVHAQLWATVTDANKGIWGK